MAPEAVQPLRINKSPSKMSSPSVNRPLAEISPMGVRRNSPSFNQTTGKPLSHSGGQSSPFEASPTNSSPRLFWKSRDATSPNRQDSENSPLRNGSSSPVRRTSLEKLKTASRVTNSQMFSREHDYDYDPANSPLVDRPFASNRPLSLQVQGNAWLGAGLESMRNDAPSSHGHRRTESSTNIPTIPKATSPTKATSPYRAQLSPQKSSLSNSGRYGSANMFDPEEGTWSDGETSTRANTPKALRQAKSVTFDNAPPQVNEYEMVTPDPSSVASGSREGSYDSEPFDMDDAYERQSSSEREDSFDESLEDADKTPVVLPEDWRFMSPEAANTGLADTFDDPFDHPRGVPSPSARYRPTPERDMGVARSTSNTSNGDTRPLPPLPPSQIGHRSIPSKDSMPKSPPLMSSPPRPASVSKAEILGMRSSPIPLDERLRLLSIEQAAHPKTEKANSSRDSDSTKYTFPQTLKGDNKSGQAESQNEKKESITQIEYKPPPRVSRESILRNLRPQDSDDIQCEDSSPAVTRSVDPEKIDYSNLDPDVPIPSREISSEYSGDEPQIPIKQEDSDNGSLVDMYACPEDEDVSRSVSPVDDYGIESSVIHYDIPHSDTPEIEQDEVTENHDGDDNDDAPSSAQEGSTTPKKLPFDALSEARSTTDSSRMSLPEFTSIFSNDDFGFGLQSYLTPQKEVEFEPEKKSLPVVETREPQDSEQLSFTADEPVLLNAPEPQEGLYTPMESVESLSQTSRGSAEGNASTPESVIHHPVEEEQSPSKSSPSVPEPVATIKAPGTKLKTRLSSTPADLQAMSATRRQISGEQPAPIAEQRETSVLQDASADELAAEPKNNEDGTMSSMHMKLDVPLLGGTEELGLGLGEEFDRLLEGKKKGYLMRQNTKLVVATNRQASGESNPEAAKSTDKTIAAPGESLSEEVTAEQLTAKTNQKSTTTWTTEPWNGRMRRHSTRRSNIIPDKRLPPGPAPPLPGQESNVTEAMETVSEDQYDTAFDDVNESGERGRLFVKVVGVKDLDLPLPKNERCHFQMTLDNGLHCVTTAWAELGRTSPIGQEFELVVFEDLEFQLTLQTKLERPKSSASSVQSLTPSLNSKKPSALSRMFTSPKKRREQEKKQRDEQVQVAMQREKDLESQRVERQPTAWDLQNELVGPDGSFARAYISLGNHERQAFGRSHSVDIPCWNEWAVEEKSLSSTRSKTGGVQRRPPYRIGKMELQLLYIPRPPKATDEDMPKSMSAASRQLKEAEAIATRQFEGHLSQQGGDCPFWRRRFFKLNGSRLTAYHDMTRQPRATISLAKATKLIDDKSSLTQPDPTTAKSKGRRKSAFAEEEEGYMFVEEGFRIRFANGEVIDFYADNAADKEKWMRVLSDAVGKQNPEEKTTWMSMVLAKERTAASTAAKSSASSKGSPLKESQIPLQKPSKSAPSSPRKPQVTAATGRTSGAAFKENSTPPEKPVVANKLKSPTKLSTSAAKPQASSPVKEYKSPSKRNSAGVVPSASPRKQTKEVAGKRQAVRSMVF